MSEQDNQDPDHSGKEHQHPQNNRTKDGEACNEQRGEIAFLQISGFAGLDGFLNADCIAGIFQSAQSSPA